MIIDFSSRLESGVRAVFPDVIVQKCTFHACQLLTRGLLKEFTKVKNEYLQAHLKEWNELRKRTISSEKNEGTFDAIPFKFDTVEESWRIYAKLNVLVSLIDPKQIEMALSAVLSSPQFTRWEGKEVFLSKYGTIFTKRKFKFSLKAMKYVTPKIYKAFRAAIREQRKILERSKSRFKRIKYLVLTNPANMSAYQLKTLRKYLKEFPWLCKYRQTLIKFYYQFRVPSEKRSPLSFLLQLLTDTSHPWLKSAVQTLIENEENVFQFQRVPELFPKAKFSKSIKVVNESCNKIVNHLYRTQCGMRTLENICRRVSHRLKCPIIISPKLLAKVV